MNEGMNALANKMEPFHLPLVVEMLELNDPLEEKLVGEFELLIGDLTLVHYSDGDDKLAVMEVVSFRKEIFEQTRSQTVEVEE